MDNINKKIMEKIFENPSRFAEIASKIDGNFLSVANSVFRLAYPTSTLRGLALGDAPTAPATMDAYLVTENGTVWGVAVQKDNFIRYNGTGWDVLPLKLPDLASGLTASTTASGVSFDNTGTAFTGATVQAVLNEADTRITDAESTADDAATAASTAATAVVELNTRMTTAEGEIDTLQSTVAGIETLLAAI